MAQPLDQKWMRDPNFLGGHNKRVVDHHAPCFFQFVTDLEGHEESHSFDESQKLVIINATKMPYVNNR
jgi:hypothetical protein